MVQVVTNENVMDLIQNRAVPEFKAPEAPKAEDPKAEAPKAEAKETPAEPEKAEQPRDEDGKFTSQAAQPADAPQDDDDTSALSAPIKTKIDKLIAKKHRAMKEAEEFAVSEARRALAAEARAAELQAQIDALKAPQKSEGPAPDGEPKPEDFKTVGEYAKALTKWEVEQARKAEKAESEQKSQKQQQEAKMAEFAQRVKAAAEKVPDYGAVVSSVETVVPDHIGSYIVDSEHGPMLGYMLAKHPDELDRIVKLSPTKALVEVGKLEAKWFDKAPEPTTKTPEVSKAPPPITPIEGKTVPVVKRPEEMTFAELKAYREAQRREGKWKPF